MNYWQQSNRNIYVAAHRGWRARYPENTMAAFRAALELGTDQIETDVRVTRDGALVLIHDDTVDRTTNGHGKVCELTLAELKALDAGNGERIPTLDELMELVKDHPTITLDLELKEYPIGEWATTAFAVCDRVLATVDAYGFTDRCVINSWNGALNEYVYRTYGRKYRQHVYYPKKHLGVCTIDPYAYGYCACVFGRLDSPQFHAEVRQFHADTGVRVWAGSYAKDEASIECAVQFGAELITCDNPDEVLEILRRKGLHP
ncbi:MAG: hypothetical protein IJY28_10975 [Clostridia bacterium]|nr:hypothetical protein [Clostridia bacterium]